MALEMANFAKRKYDPENEEDMNRILEMLYNSEMSCDSSDGDDPSRHPRPVAERRAESDSPDEESESGAEAAKDASMVSDAASDKSARRQIWKRQPFQSKQLPRAPDDLHAPEVRTPLQYFREYFSDEFFENAAKKTNMYSTANTGLPSYLELTKDMTVLTTGLLWTAYPQPAFAGWKAAGHAQEQNVAQLSASAAEDELSITEHEQWRLKEAKRPEPDEVQVMSRMDASFSRRATALAELPSIATVKERFPYLMDSARFCREYQRLQGEDPLCGTSSVLKKTRELAVSRRIKCKEDLLQKIEEAPPLSCGETRRNRGPRKQRDVLFTDEEIEHRSLSRRRANSHKDRQAKPALDSRRVNAEFVVSSHYPQQCSDAYAVTTVRFWRYQGAPAAPPSVVPDTMPNPSDIRENPSMGAA
ncbi:uncharacterized protein LOC135389345 [Ornithodoros turicata]|uniref:uncharacterized protein LOC135389345 n=1 Tax=Ornithodoros turicata TaxID=34597 RepID=UPI003139FE60